MTTIYDALHIVPSTAQVTHGDTILPCLYAGLSALRHVHATPQQMATYLTTYYGFIGPYADAFADSVVTTGGIFGNPLPPVPPTGFDFANPTLGLSTAQYDALAAEVNPPPALMAYQADHLRGPGVLLMTPPAHEPCPDRILDDGIAVSTVSPFTHAALVVGTAGHLVLVEALWRITVSPLDKYAATGWYYPLTLTATQSRVLESAARSKIGQLYGLSVVWQDFVRDDLHVDLHPRLDPRHMDCSEFVVWSVRQAGVRLTYAPAPSPADLGYSVALRGPRPWDRSPS